MPSLEPPEYESIRTLYLGGLDARITEQDLRDHFYAHGEIESVKMVLQRACAFVIYTTKEGTEKAAEELANKLVIKGLRLKLLWGKPQAPKPESEGSDQASQQATEAHSGLFPRAVISQQQTLQPTDVQNQPPMPYFNIPPLPEQDRTYYPEWVPSFHLKRDLRVHLSLEDHMKVIVLQIRSSNAPPPHIQFYPPYNPRYGYMPPPVPPPRLQYPQPPYPATASSTSSRWWSGIF